jgi:hypothetical protein
MIYSTGDQRDRGKIKNRCSQESHRDYEKDLDVQGVDSAIDLFFLHFLHMNNELY